MDLGQSLQKIIQAIDLAEKEESKVGWEIERLTKELADLGITDIENADKFLQELDGNISELDAEITAGVERLQTYLRGKGVNV